MIELGPIISAIISRRSETTADRSLLVGVSGIDASGKGFVSQRLAAGLESAGYRVALINADGWLNLSHVRFSSLTPGLHFYNNALRLDEMFEQLILPLKRDRSVNLTMDYTDENAAEYRPHRYTFSDIDIVLLEGIFIFKRQFVSHFDLKIWVECSFETALERAIHRNQEGLSATDTAAAYESIYFPAQMIHRRFDDPTNSADLVYWND